MCAADTTIPVKFEKPCSMNSKKPVVVRPAATVVVIAITALIACLDSSIDVLTLEEAARTAWESRLLIAGVCASVTILLVGRACRGSWRPVADPVAAQSAVEKDASPAAALVEEQAHYTEAAECTEFVPTETSERVGAEFADLFDDFDIALSDELQSQLSTVMSALEAEQQADEAAIHAQDLTQEAVNAFDAKLISQEKQQLPRQAGPALGIDEALNRLEQDVQRRSGESVRLPHRSRTSPVILAALAGVVGLCGVYADRLQAAEICSSSELEVAIVFVFMPVGYALFPYLGLRRSVSTS